MKKKTFFGFLALIIAAGIVIACGIGSQVDGHWFQNPNVETWFHSWGQEEKPEENISILAYTLSADEYEAYGIDPQTVTEAKSLSIDFKPTNTSDKRINWHVNFKNENSEWARGRNVLDYVQFVPSANYGSTATIGIKQPFGETILVEACSRSNPDLKAMITVERVARMSGLNNDSSYLITFDDWNNKTPIDLLGDLVSSDTDGYCDYYTVLPDEIRGTVWFEQDKALWNYIHNKGCDDGEGFTSAVDLEYLTNWQDFFRYVDPIYINDCDVSEYLIMNNESFFGILHFEFDYYYDGVKIGSCDSSVDVELSQEFINAFALPATSLTPNTDKVIF